MKTDHLTRATEWLDLVYDCHNDGLRQDEAIAVAAAHALVAIAESLRSGTIERTETVQHVWDAPGSNLAASEPEQAPTATPEPERPQEGLTAAGLDALPSGSVVTADGGRTTWIRHPCGDWVSNGSEEALTSNELAWISNGPVMLEHRPLMLADDEVIVKLTPGYSDHTLRDAAKGLESLGWPRAAFALEALADALDAQPARDDEEDDQ